MRNSIVAHHPRWRLAACVVLGAMAALQAVVRMGPVTAERGGLALTIAVTALIGASLFGAAWNRWSSPQVKQSLLLLGASYVIVASGHVLRMFVSLGMPAADIPHLDAVSEVLIWLLGFLALVRFPLSPLGPEHRWRATLDILVSFLGMLLLVAVIWMLPGYSNVPAEPRSRLMFFNLMEAGNLLVLNLILVRKPIPEIRRAVRWTVAGIAADTVYLLVFQFLTGCENYDGRLLNALFYLDTLFFVLAGFAFLAGPQEPGRAPVRVSLLHSINPLPFCATIAVGLLLVASAYQHRMQAVVVLSSGMSAMTLLLLVRVVLSARESLRVTQERFRAEQDSQENTMRLMRRLSGGISHVINNQMTAIIGNAQLLGESASLTSEELGMLNTMGKAARLASGLANRLMLASGSRRLPLQEAPWPLAKAVAARRDALARAPGDQAGASVHWELAEGQGDAPIAPSDLEAILQELLTNAQEATSGKPGQVRVRVRDETVPPGLLHGPSAGNYSVLEVADEGKGIAPEDLAHVAEPFFSRQPHGEGRGLGLTVVSGIAARYRGSLRIDPTEGAGARIRVYLPRPA